MRFTSSIVIVTLALAACANAVSVPRAAPQMTAQEIQAVTQALELTLIKNLTAIIDPSAIITGQCYVEFVAINPVPIPLTIVNVTAIAGQNGTTYSSFSQTFTNFTLPAAINATGDSGQFGGVTLTKGAIGSLPLLGSNYIDIQNTNISILAYDHFPIILTSITQNHVPASFNITI